MNTIKIDPDRTLGTLDRNVFGGFAEHLGRCIYGGIYDEGSPLADAEGYRRDVVAAMKRLRMSVIRYPGGNFVSGYRWMDGIGPKEGRPRRAELAWHTVESNRFGTDEFVRWCRLIGAEPYLAVNCGDGDMREARDWVEYCNGTTDTELVRMRRRNGSEAPHRVRYWGIGNEVDGPWQMGMKTPEEYARAYTEFGKLMRMVDPDIQLIASWTSGWFDDWVERGQLLLEQAPRLVDYMAIHWYVGNREDDFARYMALSELFEGRLTAAEGLIEAMRLCRRIAHPVHLAVDEWNVWYRTCGDNQLAEVYNLEDALVVAMQLNAFIRHARSVKMANLAQVVNVIAPMMTWEDGLVLQTTFHPFEVYSQQAGSVSLDAYWEGETFQGGDHAGVRVLDVSATLNPEARQVSVFVVNRSLEASEVEVALQEGSWGGSGTSWVVNGPDIKTANTREDPEAITTVAVPIEGSGKRLRLTLEPHSVTALTLPIV